MDEQRRQQSGCFKQAFSNPAGSGREAKGRVRMRDATTRKGAEYENATWRAAWNHRKRPRDDERFQQTEKPGANFTERGHTSREAGRSSNTGQPPNHADPQRPRNCANTSNRRRRYQAPHSEAPSPLNDPGGHACMINTTHRSPGRCVNGTQAEFRPTTMEVNPLR